MNSFRVCFLKNGPAVCGEKSNTGSLTSSVINHSAPQRRSSRRETDAPAPLLRHRMTFVLVLILNGTLNPQLEVSNPRSCVSVCVIKPTATIFSEGPWPSSSGESIHAEKCCSHYDMLLHNRGGGTTAS